MAGNMGLYKIEADLTTPADGANIVSYLSDSAGNFLTSTLVGSDQSLDVNLTAANFTYAEDAAHTSGDEGAFVLAVRNDAGTALAGTDGDYIPLSTDSSGALRTTATLDATFDFVHEEDTAHTSGDLGSFSLGVRNDANATLTSADGDYSPIAVDSAGRIKTVAAGIFAEDDAHTTADDGQHILAVRQDTTASNVSATGDYSSLQTWSNGELKSADIVNLSNLQQRITVGATAVALPASALANRKSLFVQNVGTTRIYVGSSTVTTAGATQGLFVPRGGYIEVDAGPAQDVQAISSAAGGAVVVWELS